MNLRQLFDPISSTYSYLLWDEKTREAVFIDSVKEQLERDIRLIKELDLNLKYILETHIHADHITAAGKLRLLFNAQVVVHKHSDSDCPDILVSGGEQLQFGGNSIDILYTPRHTNTDISFLIEGAVFTGDTLLIRGSGRTDFQSGDAGAAYDSITQKLFTLPLATVVYPGHDYNGLTASSIAEERQHNPRIHDGITREQYIETMDNMDLPKPKKISVAVPANLNCGFSQQG